MTDNEARRLAAAELLVSPFWPVTPLPKQAAFLLDMRKEVLYGGAAGGAKSVAMLMAALQYVGVPGYSAIIFRRTLTDLNLPSGLIPVAKAWLAGKASWSATENTFHFPSGATLTFGYLDHDGAEHRYQGSEFQFIGFDEVTQFTEQQYTYMFSRLRSGAGPGDPLGRVPKRMRATANPGGRGHEWVRDRFILPWRRHIDAGTTDDKRWFHPATVADNPYLDDEYLDNLSELDPVTRAQLRDGDWDIRPEGRMFNRNWFKVVRAVDIPDGCSWIRYWDLAATAPTPTNDPDYTAGVLVAYHRQSGMCLIRDVVRLRASANAVEQRIRQTAEADGRSVTIHFEQEPGSSGKTVIDHYIRRVLPEFTVRSNRPTGSKLDRAQPLSARAERGDIQIIEGSWNEALLAELELFPDGAHDDQVDALAGAYTALVERSELPLVAPAAILKDPGRTLGRESWANQR